MLILVSRKKGEQTLKQFLFELSKLLNLVSRKKRGANKLNSFEISNGTEQN